MNIEQFEHGLDIYGPNVDQWPTDEAAAAQSFLTDSIQAQELLRADAGVAEILASAQLSSHVAPGYLRGKILANLVEVSPLQSLLGWFTVSMWRAAATALLPLLIGFGAGVFSEGMADNYGEIEGLVYLENLEGLEYDEF